MFKNLKTFVLSAACVIVGLIMLVMAFSEPDFSFGSRIFSGFCGLIFIVGGGAIRASRSGEIQQARAQRRAREERWKQRADVFAAPAADDASEAEAMLRSFRDEYGRFFAAPGVQENPPVQQSVTQLYRNVLALQKKRLDERGVQVSIRTERKDFGVLPPVAQRQFFDGKYEISEYDETVAVQKTFTCAGRVIHTKTARRVAHIGAIHAKRTGKKKIICPNCGAATTRENLLDGCDYCGTRFSVEDLGTKVSSFRLRDDYELQYAEFRDARAHYNEKVFWYQAVVYFFLILTYSLFTQAGELKEVGGNQVTSLLTLPLASAITAGLLAAVGTYLFFWPFVFPLLQAKATVSYRTKKQLNAMRSRNARDIRAETLVRTYDPLFSISGFCSNLNNKLAVIHFADTAAGANAFTEDGAPTLIPSYANVIDMDFVDARIRDYKAENGLQRIRAEAHLNLTEFDGTAVHTRRERLRLVLVKNAACKTQEVCAPSVMICKGCGSSLSLENGKTCAFCGRTLDLKQYDWVIRSYEIM